jgi:hypothetical protein
MQLAVNACAGAPGTRGFRVLGWDACAFLLLAQCFTSKIGTWWGKLKKVNAVGCGVKRRVFDILGMISQSPDCQQTPGLKMLRAADSQFGFFGNFVVFGN